MNLSDYFTATLAFAKQRSYLPCTRTVCMRSLLFTVRRSHTLRRH